MTEFIRRAKAYLSRIDPKYRREADYLLAEAVRLLEGK